MSDVDETNDDVEHRLIVRQIIPTAGPWLSIFDDGSVRPIACWALIECVTHGDSYIAPMVPNDGEISDATQIEGYRDSLPELDEEELENFLAESDPDDDDDDDDDDDPGGSRSTTH